MNELTIKLNSIKDSYYGFVVAVTTYVKNNPGRLRIVDEYIDNNPDAMSSDILGFISEQPDFYDDAAYARFIS